MDRDEYAADVRPVPRDAQGSLADPTAPPSDPERSLAARSSVASDDSGDDPTGLSNQPNPPNDEAVRGTRKAQRMVSVGARAVGLALRVGSPRLLGMALNRDTEAKAIASALSSLRGPVMKVAQLLATVPNALPDEWQTEFARLQANAPPMGKLFVKRRISGELGPAWRERFTAFDTQAAHAASLGQVHRARGLDGQELAIKLQYPDMASVVEGDIRNLQLAFRVFDRANGAIDSSEIKEEIATRLREELDYRAESRRMAAFRQLLAAEENVKIPKGIEELTTRRLLTMTWLEGQPILSFTDADQELRNRIAYLLFRAWYIPFYTVGAIHGDPHPGNYAIHQADQSSSPRLNVLDFGCVRFFPPVFVAGVIDLYHALERGDEALAVHAYESWGFVGLSRELIDALNIWAGFLYGPLLEDRSRKIQEEGSGAYGVEAAGKSLRELRRLGGVRPPREFVMMDRAAVGLGSVFMRLNASLNWHESFHNLIAGFDQDQLARNQAQLRSEHDI